MLVAKVCMDMIFFNPRTVFFCFGLIFASNLFPIEQVAVPQEIVLSTVSQKPNAATEGLTHEQTSVLESMKETFAQHMHQNNKSFYTDYLARYYPRAMVIRNNFFTYAQPDQVLSALRDFCDLLADEPWFYFSNKPDGIVVSRYWVHIVDQCSLISEFLKKAHVDLATQKVFLPKSVERASFWSWGNFNRAPASQTSKSFFASLNDEQMVVIYEFYALVFDYLIKLFNKAILFQEISDARYYLYELNFANNKLRGSIFEAKYLQVMKTCKELLMLLDQKIAKNDPEDDPEGMNDRQRGF